MKVFIHTNHKQMPGAIVAKHCLERNAPHRRKFAAEVIHLDDYPHLKNRARHNYKCKSIEVAWKNEDLQSFTPPRFLPPQLMGYEERATT